MEGLFLRILSRGGKTRRQKSQQHVQYSFACAPAKPYMCSRTITLKKASTNTYVAFLQRAAHQPLGRWPHNSWLKALLHIHALTQTNHHRRLLFLAHTPPSSHPTFVPSGRRAPLVVVDLFPYKSKPKLDNKTTVSESLISFAC